MLVPLQKHKPFKLYLLADEHAIGSDLIQEFEGKECVIYFVSRRQLDAETRYSPVERLCLCLYFSCTKLRHYLLSAECVVVSKDDVIKYMFSLLLVFCNVTNKIRKRTDSAVAFTQEYSKVLYPLGNVSTLSTGLGSSKDTHADVEKTEERTFYI